MSFDTATALILVAIILCLLIVLVGLVGYVWTLRPRRVEPDQGPPPSAPEEDVPPGGMPIVRDQTVPSGQVLVMNDETLRIMERTFVSDVADLPKQDPPRPDADFLRRHMEFLSRYGTVDLKPIGRTMKVDPS